VTGQKSARHNDITN